MSDTRLADVELMNSHEHTVADVAISRTRHVCKINAAVPGAAY